MTKSKKKPLNDEQRQTFIDNLPEDQINPKVEKTFVDAIARAAKPKRSEPEKPDSAGDYTDKQTH